VKFGDTLQVFEANQPTHFCVIPYQKGYFQGGREPSHRALTPVFFMQIQLHLGKKRIEMDGTPLALGSKSGPEAFWEMARENRSDGSNCPL
jgi:hypothetical protein